MKRLSIVLCLLSLSVLADVAIVAPKDAATVSLLKDAQREYLAQPVGARHAQMADAAARAKFAKCGGRPASVKLEWQDDEFATNAVYEIVLTRPECTRLDRFEIVGAQQAEIVNLNAGVSYEWEVRRVDGASAKAASFKTAAEPRLMYIPGVPNCRDLGGKSGLGGRRLRQGRVYRTATYNGSSKRVGDSFFDAKFVPGEIRITRAGRREMVEKCGIRTDLDLRNEEECAGMSGSPLGTNVMWTHIPIRAYGWLENDKPAIGRIMKLFADGANYPIAFHCSGGRDRAGSLAFLLEGLCGVSEDELRRDWELSIFDNDDLGFGADRLEGLVSMLNTNYPGADMGQRIEAFVKSCGVTDEEIAAIRALMLE